MKQVLLERYGAPAEAVRCAEVPDPGPPGPGEAVFDVLAFPINPADLSMCRGTYRLRPVLPAGIGAECVGRVSAVGPGVAGVAPGDLVVNLQRENWTQRRRVPADDLIPVPDGLDLLQAAMLRINPPTALLLLTDVVTLQPGDWIIQNVANSAVGRFVIHLARSRGLHTVNVVRRERLFADLAPLGADVCVVDGPDLAERVRGATGGASIRLGLDAVSGPATARISQCVGEAGTVCNYGSMSGEDPIMPRSKLISEGQRLVGFILGRALAPRSRAQVRAIYAELAEQVRAGLLTAPVERTYPIEEITTAVAHAERGERSGKILVVPNHPLR
ncbi:MAG TPA: zinc-dependent alcohol dehydrogenase family protein [Methylomirabilota bacterium]